MRFSDTSDFLSLLSFIIKISGLQRLRRTAWETAGVRNPERVSGHMFRMGVMAIVMESEDSEADDRIMGGSAVVVSIVHDLAEYTIADNTPSNFVVRHENHESKVHAMMSLVKDLPCLTHGMEIINTFMRYEKQAEHDSAAKLTKDLKMFETVVQAMEYEENRQTGTKTNLLQVFFDLTENCFMNNSIRTWDKKLRDMRNQRIKAAEKMNPFAHGIKS